MKMPHPCRSFAYFKLTRSTHRRKLSKVDGVLNSFSLHPSVVQSRDCLRVRYRPVSISCHSRVKTLLKILMRCTEAWLEAGAVGIIAMENKPNPKCQADASRLIRSVIRDYARAMPEATPRSLLLNTCALRRRIISRTRAPPPTRMLIIWDVERPVKVVRPRISPRGSSRTNSTAKRTIE